MKKLKTYISIVSIVVLLGTCIEFGSPRPIQPTVPASVQDGDSDSADFSGNGIWISPEMVRVTVANLTTGRKAALLSFQCSVFDQNGSLVFQSARQQVLPGRFGHLNILKAEITMMVWLSVGFFEVQGDTGDHSQV